MDELNMFRTDVRSLEMARGGSGATHAEALTGGF